MHQLQLSTFLLVKLSQQPYKLTSSLMQLYTTLTLSAALGVFLPDLEVEGNAPDVNDVTAEEEAMPGTPAFELQEARALYED